MSKNDPPVLTDPYASGGPPSAAPAKKRAPEAAPRATLVSGREPPPPEKPSPWAADVEKKKRRKKLLGRAAVILGGALVVGGVAAGAVLLLRRAREVPVSPCPLADLPKATAYVERLPTRWVYLDVGDLPEVPPQAGWSHYAEHFCGGSDVFQNLLRARSDGARRLVAGAIYNRRDTGDALECGKRLLEAHVGETSFYVRAIVPPVASVLEPEAPASSDRPTPDWFAVDRFDVERLPESSRRYRTWRDRGALEGTRCALPIGTDPRKNCGPSAQASARLAKTDLFVSSTLEHLQYYGREHGTSDARRDEAVLEAITRRVGAYEAAVIGTSEGFSASFPRRLGIAIARAEGSGSAEDRALYEAIDETESHFGIGDGFAGAKGGRFRLELVPKRERDADDVARALEKWRDRLVRDLDGREPDFEPLLGYTPLPTEREYRAMVHRASLAVLEEAPIEVDDGVVSLSVEVAYDPAGRRLADDFLAELAERAKLAAEVVIALERGERPERDALLELGGSELVSLVDRPENGVED